MCAGHHEHFDVYRFLSDSMFNIAFWMDGCLERVPLFLSLHIMKYHCQFIIEHNDMCTHTRAKKTKSSNEFKKSYCAPNANYVHKVESFLKGCLDFNISESSFGRCVVDLLYFRTFQPEHERTNMNIYFALLNRTRMNMNTDDVFEHCSNSYQVFLIDCVKF